MRVRARMNAICFYHGVAISIWCLKSLVIICLRKVGGVLNDW